MDELTRLNNILEACAQRLEAFSAQILAEQFAENLCLHPDLAYLDAQLEAFYS